MPPLSLRLPSSALGNPRSLLRRAGGGGRRAWRASPPTARRGSSSQSERGGLDPALEAAVPVDQRPVNELAQLKSSPLVSWAHLPLPDFLSRLGTLFLGSAVLLGGPVSAQTYNPAQEPLAFAAAAALGGTFIAGVACVRMFLSWKFVGDRLLTATLEYEETGWYDGQLYSKPPEVLARDRLLGIYEVKPVLQRLERALMAAGGGAVGLVAALVLLNQGAPAGPTDATGRRVPAAVTRDGIIFSSRVKDLSDEAAEAEALAQGGVPGYCGDRYFRAAAGGQFCKKFDVR